MATIYEERGFVDEDPGRANPGPNWAGYTSLYGRDMDSISTLGTFAGDVVLTAFGNFGGSEERFMEVIGRFAETADPPIKGVSLGLFKDNARKFVEDRTEIMFFRSELGRTQGVKS